jgi:Ribonucleotide reductase, small chain
VDTATFSAEAAGSAPARHSSEKIGRLLREIDTLIADDEASDRQITGAWRTFGDIIAAAHTHVWDAYSVDLSADAESFRGLSRRQQDAVKRVFGTIYRAESIVDDWMDRIVAALPREAKYESMRAALMTQEHDERMHRGSLIRIATEVLGIPRDDVDQVARKYNNFVAEMGFDRFEAQMGHLLRPNRPVEDVFTAIFIYGVISEDVVANSDVVIRRAKGNALYDVYHLPGMKEGQTNVRRDEGRHVRIAVLATHRFLEEFEDAAERLLAVCRDYMDLGDRMVRRAKASRGLIDSHLAESYGPDVDSLYYYVMNMKRLAVRLDELGLRDGVLEVKRRVDAAIAELTGEDGEPIVETPSRLLKLVGPTMLRLAAATRLAG